MDYKGKKENFLKFVVAANTKKDFLLKDFYGIEKSTKLN